MTTLHRGAITLAAAFLLAACSSTTSSHDSGPAKPPAQELRDLDQAAYGHADAPASYDQAFATLSQRCQEQSVGLGSEVHAVLGLLKDKGIADETHLSVMQHLAASIPDGSPKMSCADIGGSYVTLRTHGQ